MKDDPWQSLRACTPARIGLGQTGTSLPTNEVLQLGLAHAQARDAVHCPTDFTSLSTALVAAGFRTLKVSSQAEDRRTYLLRPDKGRLLSDASQRMLEKEVPAPRLVVVIADGLSSSAIHDNALPVLQALREQYDTDWSHTPVVLAEQARVALGDCIGEALSATFCVMLIGERPGLSVADSLGAYITWQPQKGRMDSERNCVSNIHAKGLSAAEAAHKIAWLLHEAARIQQTGVHLKDLSDTSLLQK